MSPRVLQVIESEVSRGCGHPEGYDCPRRDVHTHEVCRRVKQYHTLDGEFLAEFDICPIPANPVPADGWVGTV